MSPKDIKSVEAIIRDLAQKIEAPENTLPAFGEAKYDSQPYIEVEGRYFITYSWKVSERGQELENKTTSDFNHFLYWVFEAITSQMATIAARGYDDQNEDPRRYRFQKQEQLLGSLDPSWEEKQKKEHEAVLRRYPFDDNVMKRAHMIRELRSNGSSYEEAERSAIEKYPKSKK